MVKGNSKGFLFPALRSSKKGDFSMDKPALYGSVLDQFKSIVKEAGAQVTLRLSACTP